MAAANPQKTVGVPRQVARVGSGPRLNPGGKQRSMGTKVDSRTKFFYGIGSVAFGVKDSGFAFFLLFYYGQVLGLPPSRVGLGILIALVCDAIVDPIVGHASDHLHSRWGRRHPFMYAAAIPVGLAFWMLFAPPRGLEGDGLFAYFVGMAVLVRLFIAVYEIPSTALVAELSDDYDERTAMMSLRYLLGWWGGLVMAVIAYGVLLHPTPAQPIGQLNIEGYRVYGLIAALLMVSAILVSALGTHRHIPNLKSPPPAQPFELRRMLRELAESLANRNFLALFLGGLFGAAAAGLSSALSIYFSTFFWSLTAEQMLWLVLAYFPAALLAFAVTPRISARWGKKQAALATGLAGFTLIPVPIVLRLLDVMPENGSSTLLPTLATFTMIEIALVITSSILVSAMVADIVEESELRTGRRSEGTFFAARMFVQKMVSGLGVLGSGLLLTAVGFPAGAKPGEVPPETLWWLGAVYAPIVAGLYLGSMACLLPYRIDREGHRQNLARLMAAAEQDHETPAALAP